MRLTPSFGGRTVVESVVRIGCTLRALPATATLTLAIRLRAEALFG
jgi:hypothetical protein